MKTMTIKKTKVKQKKIIIYGENWCPYCKNAKKIAKKITKNYKFISGKSGLELKRLLKLKNVPRTIPLITVDGRYIGGFSNLQAMYK